MTLGHGKEPGVSTVAASPAERPSVSRAGDTLVEAVQHLRRVGSGTDVDDVVETVLRAATRVLPAYDHAAVWNLAPDGSVDFHATTSLLALELDTFSASVGQGPCLDSMRRDVVVPGSHIAQNNRWRNYGPRAGASAVRSQLAAPLQIWAGSSVAALSLFSTTQGEVVARDVEMVRMLVVHADTAFARAGNAAATPGAGKRNLLIAHATGILSERHQVDQQTARRLLARVARLRADPIELVASQLVTDVHGDCPDSDLAYAASASGGQDGDGDSTAHPAAPSSRATNPPGWYRDSDDARTHRYWTGTAWRVEPDGETSTGNRPNLRSSRDGER